MRLPQGFISFSPSLPIFLQLTSPAEGYRQGDRRVSERSTLPFISPSPVSSGLTSLLSLSLYPPRAYGGHTWQGHERKANLARISSSPSSIYEPTTRLRGPATLARAQPPKRSFTRCCSSAYLLLVPE